MDANEIEAGRHAGKRRYDAAAQRDADFTTLSGMEVDPVYGPPEGADVPGFERIGWPGEYPYTRGLYPTGYRGPDLDHPPVRRLRQRRQTNERYQTDPRRRRRRAVGRLRHAHADGPRLRRPAVARRGRALRRRHRLGRRHGRALRRRSRCRTSPRA